MARTLEELGSELANLRQQVEALQRRDAGRRVHPRAMAGCFTGDPEWAAIHAQIEEQRRQPESPEGS